MKLKGWVIFLRHILNKLLTISDGYLDPNLTQITFSMYEYLTSISTLLRSGINVDDFGDSLSNTQYQSKKWLVDRLVEEQKTLSPTILILGGWYGSYLVPMLREKIKPELIYLNDIDPQVLKVAQRLHGNKGISYHCFDATDSMTLLQPDVVINTSCEHMASYDMMLSCNPNSLFVLQTCDNTNDPGHINISRSTDDFIEKLGLTNIMWSGRQNLGHKNRFMVIGKQ
jgi:hypothetical protein